MSTESLPPRDKAKGPTLTSVRMLSHLGCVYRYPLPSPPAPQPLPKCAYSQGSSGQNQPSLIDLFVFNFFARKVILFFVRFSFTWII